MNWVSAVLIFISLGVPNLNVNGKQGAITGPKAEPAEPHEFPFYAAIRIRRFGPGISCGGTLIKRNVVLTAAQCVTYQGNVIKPDQISVDLGLVNRSSDEEETVQNMEVTRVIVHPFYNADLSRTNANDVALLFLCEKAKLNAFVQLMPNLATKDDNLPIKESGNCVVIGFGETGSYEDGWVYPDLLHKADTNIGNVHKCKELVEGLGDNTKVVPKKEVCALEDDGTEACWGDIGGPLFCKPYKRGGWIQYGLVSWGPDDYCSIGITLYPRISYYRQWILRQVRRYG